MALAWLALAQNSAPSAVFSESVIHMHMSVPTFRTRAAYQCAYPSSSLGVRILSVICFPACSLLAAPSDIQFESFLSRMSSLSTVSVSSSSPMCIGFAACIIATDTDSPRAWASLISLWL